MREFINLSIAVILLIGFGSVLSQSEKVENVEDGNPEEPNTATASCNSTMSVELKESSAEYKWLIKGFLSVFKKHIQPLGEKFQFKTDNLKFNTTSNKLAGNWKFEYYRSYKGSFTSAELTATYTTPYTCQPESPTSVITNEERMNAYDKAWDSYEIGYYMVKMQIIANNTVQFETSIRKQEERPPPRFHYDYKNGKEKIELLMPCDSRTISFGEHLNWDKIFDGFEDLNDIEIRYNISVYTVVGQNTVQSIVNNITCN